MNDVGNGFRGSSEERKGQSTGGIPADSTFRQLIPATLDLAERAGLAVNAMTEATDPEENYRVYWKVTFRSNPPIMYHDFSDTGIAAKFMECLPRMRLMSGSKQGAHVEERWKELLPERLGADGMVETILYDRLSPSRPSSRLGVSDGESIVDMQVNGLMLGAATTYAETEDREYWEPIGRRIADGLARLAVRKGPHAYFTDWTYLPGDKADYDAPRPLATQAAFGIWPARRLTYFYKITGYEPAVELAGELCRYVLHKAQYFGPNYEFLCDDPDPNGMRHHVNHFHHHSMTILACLEYGRVAGDEAMVAEAATAFDKAKSYGEVLTGFFPESVGPDVPHTSEICEVGDMVSVALGLAAAGAGDHYWDDADRWIRNQLAEGQLLRYDWIYRLNMADPPTALLPNMTTDRVGERNLGAFAGWQSPNDWVEFQRAEDRGGVQEVRPMQEPHETSDEYLDRLVGGRKLGHVQGIMHCCTANGARALYDAWHHIIHRQDDRVRVNLLLNSVGGPVEVHSHLPYTGRADFHVNQTCNLSVRLPGWVELGKVICNVDGFFREVNFEGRYAVVGGLSPGQVATLTFPLAEELSRVTAKNQWYYLVRRGHDVVRIDPPGVLSPLYNRDHYRDGVTLWKQADRHRGKASLSW